MSDPEKTTQRRAQVAVMTAQGKSAAHIAAILRTTARTVCRDRAVMGIAKQARQTLTQDEIDRAAVLLADGASCSEVAKTLGRSIQPILRRFPEYVLNPHQVAARAVMGREFNRLERKLG